MPWWAIGLLVAGALALLLVGWPDPDVRSWEDPYRGWYVNESWRDIVIPVALLAAALGLRWVRELLGVVVGLSLYAAVSAFVILTAGLAHQQTEDWLAVLSLGVAMAAVAWVARRVRVRFRGPVHWLGTTLVLVGAGAVLTSSAIEAGGSTWIDVTKGLAIVSAALLVVVAWPSLVRGSDAATRRLAAVAAASVVVADGIGSMPTLTSGQTASFIIQTGGRVAVLTGIALAVAPARREPPP